MKYNIESEFLPQEESEKLIKLGIDYPFNRKISYHLAFFWFREVHHLYPEIEVDQTMEPKFCFRINWYKSDYQGNEWIDLTNREEWFLYYTQEEAELDCIRRMINIVEEY